MKSCSFSCTPVLALAPAVFALAFHPTLLAEEAAPVYKPQLFESTKLVIKKDVETIQVDAPLLPLNQWVDVAIELKKGTLVLTIDGKPHRFESPGIDMTGHAQIDFKGVDFGSCQIDHITLWEGQ